MKISHTLRTLFLALFIGVCGIGLSGCGGPGDTPTGDTPAVNEADPENASEDYIEGEENIGS